jgi:hypothetical protein
MLRTHLLTVWRTLVSRDEERAAASMLGRGDVLVRLLARRRARMEQLAVTLVPLALGLVGTARHVETAPVVLEAAALVAVVLAASIALSTLMLRDRAQEVIAAGYERLPVRVVRDERRRLLSHRRREQFARSLERLLRDAKDRSRILPSSRPPHGVRELCQVEREVHEVISLLRVEQTHAPGVARTARLLTDGGTSPLFTGDAEALRAELRRICDLLDRAERPVDTRDERLAA